MIPKNVKDNTKENQHHLNTLLQSTKHTINVIIKHNDSFAVVYAINSPDDTVIYVGSTSNIVNRMRKHLVGASTFRDKIKIKKDELKWYKIRYRRMANEIERKLFESYVIGVLKPKFNF